MTLCNSLLEAKSSVDAYDKYVVECIGDATLSLCQWRKAGKSAIMLNIVEDCWIIRDMDTWALLPIQKAYRNI